MIHQVVVMVRWIIKPSSTAVVPTKHSTSPNVPTLLSTTTAAVAGVVVESNTIQRNYGKTVPKAVPTCLFSARRAMPTCLYFVFSIFRSSGRQAVVNAVRHELCVSYINVLNVDCIVVNRNSNDCTVLKDDSFKLIGSQIRGSAADLQNVALAQVEQLSFQGPFQRL